MWWSETTYVNLYDVNQNGILLLTVNLPIILYFHKFFLHFFHFSCGGKHLISGYLDREEDLQLGKQVRFVKWPGICF